MWDVMPMGLLILLMTQTRRWKAARFLVIIPFRQVCPFGPYVVVVLPSRTDL